MRLVVREVPMYHLFFCLFLFMQWILEEVQFNDTFHLSYLAYDLVVMIHVQYSLKEKGFLRVIWIVTILLLPKFGTY